MAGMGRPKGLPKTGGKQKGSRNKRTIGKLLKIDEYCAQKGYDPLHALVDIANDPTIELLTRFEAHKAIAPYLYAKKQQVEVTGADGGPLVIHMVQYANDPDPV